MGGGGVAAGSWYVVGQSAAMGIKTALFGLPTTIGVEAIPTTVYWALRYFKRQRWATVLNNKKMVESWGFVLYYERL